MKHPLVQRGGAGPRLCHRRPGAILVLVVAAVVILLAMAMLSVDVSFIQLTRTELRAATDAAAKAGARALAAEQSEEAAVEAALDMAARNQVGGRPLILSPDEVEIGAARSGADGSWTFEAGATPSSAVRIQAHLSQGSANGAIPLFFAGIFGSNSYEPTRESTAAVMEQDICLVIDRSHSMCYDMSGVDGRYPDSMPRDEAYQSPPHPTQSRWAALTPAVDQFIDISKESTPRPRIALVTWSSDVNKSSFEYRLTGIESPVTSLDVQMGTNLDGILSSLHDRSNWPILGATNMSAGIDEGASVLRRSGRRLTAKVMILMTDGQWNRGRNPVLAAEDARRASIVIHVVSLLENVDHATMDEVAAVTGGRHYHAANAEELTAAFEELARTLPVVLTE